MDVREKLTTANLMLFSGTTNIEKYKFDLSERMPKSDMTEPNIIRIIRSMHNGKRMSYMIRDIIIENWSI